MKEIFLCAFYDYVHPSKLNLKKPTVNQLNNKLESNFETLWLSKPKSDFPKDGSDWTEYVSRWMKKRKSYGDHYMYIVEADMHMIYTFYPTGDSFNYFDDGYFRTTLEMSDNPENERISNHYSFVDYVALSKEYAGAYVTDLAIDHDANEDKEDELAIGGFKEFPIPSLMVWDIIALDFLAIYHIGKNAYDYSGAKLKRVY